MKVAALVISVNEPQLKRCLESVQKQTVPFSDIVHINNRFPEYLAFNEGVRTITEDYFMKIDGDMILTHSALEIALQAIGTPDPAVYSHNFRLLDTFFQAILRGVGIMNKALCRKFPYFDRLDNDRVFGYRLRVMGFKKINYGPVIATHFDKPDEFQVFRRFYCLGVKHGTKMHLVPLENRFKETKDPLFELGIKALLYGDKRKEYQGSHNVEQDKKLYQEFLHDNGAHPLV